MNYLYMFAYLKNSEKRKQKPDDFNSESEVNTAIEIRSSVAPCVHR